MPQIYQALPLSPCWWSCLPKCVQNRRCVSIVDVFMLNITESQINYVRQGRYVMPGVCLSVCLLSTLHKSYWTDLHENFTTDVFVHKEELIKFRKSSMSRSADPGIFGRIVQHCETGHFPQFGLYLRREWSDFHEDSITDASLDKKVPIKFWK